MSKYDTRVAIAERAEPYRGRQLGKPHCADCAQKDRDLIHKGWEIARLRERIDTLERQAGETAQKLARGI